jgi:hypothetical protein
MSVEVENKPIIPQTSKDWVIFLRSVKTVVFQAFLKPLEAVEQAV